MSKIIGELFIKPVIHNFCIFENFLYVEQQFIAKNSVASWALAGWANQAKPSCQICPNQADSG